MKTFLLITSFVIAGSLIWFSVSSPKNIQKSVSEETSTVSLENDIQIIEVISKSGGYYPSNIVAKAGSDTRLILNSQNSYGCERAFRIPQLNINEILPVDGQTTFDLGIPQKGDEIFASCSMGMYTFRIIFE